MKNTRKILVALVMVLTLLLSLATITSSADETEAAAAGNVAKVGDTEYATIDEAIAAWTNNTTLTLLADVTLSDVIKLSSTEYHILDLGTYTMTAASGKDAIQYVVNGRSTLGYALDIKADAENPGGITATGGSVVRHTKPTSSAPSKDRPITRFYGGIFNASYIVRQGGSWGAGYTGASAPAFHFYGGEFNGTIYTNRSINLFYGGVFTGSMQMSVDSSAYTLISGGTFQKLSNMMGSDLTTGNKFTIGSSKGANDGSVCVDESGNYVISTTTPTVVEASVASNYNSSNYFYYSTVNTNGMYYEDVYDALEANQTATVTVYTDNLDLEGSSFAGTIVVPEGNDITITNPPADITVQRADGTVITPDEDGTISTIVPVEVATYDELVAALANGGSIKLTADITVDTRLTAIDGTVINLGGKTLYVNVENSYYNNVTIKNGNIVLGKDDVHVCDGYFLVNEGKTLTVDGVKISSSDEGIKGYAVFHLKTGASLDLIDSELNIVDNEYAAGYIVYAGEATATVDVVGTTVTGSKVNGIVHATTVIEDSTFEITEATEHGINRSGVTITDSTVAISGGTGRGITAQHGPLVINGNSTVTIENMGEATIELRGNQNLTIAETATVKLDVAVNNTTSGTVTGTVILPPMGNDFNGYTGGDAIWGEVWGNARESFVIKVLDANGNVMGTTTLNNIGGIIDGDVNVTWNLKLDAASNTDEYWTMEWTTAPTVDNMPAKVELWVDGVKVSGGPVVLNGPDEIAKIYAANVDGDGKILSYYTNVQEAIKAAAPAGNVEILRDVTVDEWIMFAEKMTISDGSLITLNINGLTIDGNGHTLTIKSIESASNGGYLFYDAENLNVKDLTINFADGLVGGIGLQSGTIEGVTFNGGQYNVLPGKGGVNITGCTFNNTKGYAIYFEDAREGIVITDNTFNTASGAYAITMRSNEQFAGNTIVTGRVNIANSSNATVTGNDFGTERFKVYNGATATVTENKINNLVFNDDSTTYTVFESNTLSDSAKESLEAVLPVYLVELNGVQYESLADAFAAAANGDTIVLIADVELDAPITVKNNITLDGNGHKITQSSECNNNIALLYFEGSADNVLDITVKNATFDGLKVGAAIRTLYANISIDNCVFQNLEHSVGQGLVRLTYGTAKIANSKFLNNNCAMGISFNWDGNGLDTDTLTVDNCVFENNTANKTALIYYVKGIGCTITGSEFVENDVNCSNNGAVIYLGFQENCVVTGNLFKNNSVVDSSTSQRVAGAIFAGYQATITGNVFDGNTATNANGDTLGQVCVSTYYEDGAIDISSNYWNGIPDPGSDYFVQHQTGSGKLELNDYYPEYSIDENGDVVVENAETITYAAKIGKYLYTSLADAFAALTNGATLIIYEGTYDYALALGAGTSNITVIGEGNVTLNGIPSIKGTNYRVENIDFVYADSYNNLSGSGYIKDCTFTNNTNNTFRYCYGVTNGEITFDGCTLTAKQWAIHFDSVAGTKLNFINCNVNGRVALGADLGALTATGTNFENGYVNVWGSAEEVSFSDCEFVNIPYIFTGYDKGNTFKFNDCTVVDADGVQTGVIDLIYGGNDSANADIYVDDVLKSGDAKIGDAYYRTVTDAINAAVDGDVITIQARTISEEIVVSDHINRFGGKNITIEGAADFGTTLTGGLYIGYDDNNPYTGSVTVRGIKFEGKGLTLVQLDSVTVEGCQFSNMANFARAAGESFNAITVICDDLTDSVVIKNNVINGAEMGIRVRSPKALTVENNTISNTLHNAITVENSKFATNDAPVVIADNNITNWGLSGEGRALRMVLGSGDNIQAKSVTVTGNLMETDVAPEGFIKMTAVDSTMTVNLSSNVLIGELADGAEAIAIEGTGADSVDTSNNPAVESNEPHILDGYWWIGTYNTGVRAEAISIESAEVNADNELVITLSNGAVLNLGNVKGDAGRGIVNVTINANNELVIEYTDGTTAVLGNVKGDTGVGIKDVKLVDYELIVTLTDGTEINLGNIRGQQGVGVGKVEIVDNKLIVTLTDGTVVDLGNVKGDEGRGVENVEKNDKNEFVITLTDGTVINLGNVKGDTGTGIEKIEKNDKNELVITLTDGTVVNLGNIKGDQGIQGIPGEKGEKGDDGIDGADGADGNDNNQVVITSIAVATAAIIFALAVLLFWRAKRRSWWCIR